MGQVFRKTTTRPVPSGAKIVEVGGKLTARWKGRGNKAKWMTAQVVTLDDGRQVIRQESSTYFAQVRDQDKALITVSTGCRDESAAKQVLAGLERRVERIRSRECATVQENKASRPASVPDQSATSRSTSLDYRASGPSRRHPSIGGIPAATSTG